jgi:aminopeptidase YwaD
MHPKHYPVAILVAVLTAGTSVGLALLPAPDPALDPADDLSPVRYAEHVGFLASTDMQGRGNGSAELEEAAEYLASQFRLWGLEPAGENGSYFQGFEATTDTVLGEASSMTLGSADLEPMVDFAPLKFSATGTASGELVFVGYGITAPEMHWDDYNGVDVTDKIVVAFRHEPQENDEDSPFAGTSSTSHASLMNKAINAKQHGAAGILFIMDPNDHQPDEQELLTTARGTTSDDSGLIAAYVRMEPVLDYFQVRGFDLREAQRTIDEELVSRSFEVPGSAASIASDVRRVRSPLRNVIAKIEGSDPALRDEWVVVGAHYDHLGRDGEFSLDSEGEGQIHHGADDNASGTAGILELARVASMNRDSFGRSILFMGFSGEEIGLLGSNHFVNDPTITIENAAAMINLDMIGRLRDERVYASGVGTGSGFAEMLEGLNDTGLALDYSDSGMGGSDHMSFNIKEVPVLFFFSGLHADYHKPSDTAEKIDAEGAMKVLRLTYRTMEQLANQVERPLYTQVEELRPISGSGGGYGPYFGSIPDFREVDGVMFADVNAGSPAADAGFTGGDILVEFNGNRIQNLYDFTYALQAQQVGDTIPVAVMRGDQRIEADVTLEAR